MVLGLFDEFEMGPAKSQFSFQVWGCGAGRGLGGEGSAWRPVAMRFRDASALGRARHVFPDHFA